MKKFLLFSIACLAAAAGAQAQEVGRVISSVAVIQQLAVPRQVCSQQPVVVQQPSSGAGGLMGAIAGGAMGNAVGDGSGRAIATVIGLVGGAMLGNRIEGSGTQVQNMQQCTTQTFYENRAVAYNVTYEYAGKQYTVQMPNDPGPTVRLQITPVGANASEPVQYGAPSGSTNDSMAVVGQQQNSASGYPSVQPGHGQPAFVQPENVPQAYVQSTISQPVLVAPPTVVYQTYSPYAYFPYYARPYYPPLGISLNFGYSRGGHRHHRNWR